MYVYSPIDASSPDYDRFPLFREAEAIEFDQYAGDMLFIPSGWFHQVGISASAEALVNCLCVKYRMN